MRIPPELRDEVASFTQFLDSQDALAPYGYELLESRLDCLKLLTHKIERSGDWSGDDLLALREWFRAETDPWILRGRLMNRARTWPEGYPGDYKTLEAVYANTPAGDDLLAKHLDRYFLGRTLAVAVRSRCRYLSELLNARAAEEAGGGSWLNIACGSCRELLGVTVPPAGRRVVCVDQDRNAVDYAATLLQGHPLGEVRYVAENAYRFVNADRTVAQYGQLTTVYSAGLFDYIPDDKLAPLMRGLYDSMAPGGLFIAPFKDRWRYETFDYHWLVRWHHFYQRDEADFRRVFAAAGIPDGAITATRDPSRVLLFFTIRR